MSSSIVWFKTDSQQAVSQEIKQNLLPPPGWRSSGAAPDGSSRPGRAGPAQAKGAGRVPLPFPPGPAPAPSRRPLPGCGCPVPADTWRPVPRSPRHSGPAARPRIRPRRGAPAASAPPLPSRGRKGRAGRRGDREGRARAGSGRRGRDGVGAWVGEGHGWAPRSSRGLVVGKSLDCAATHSCNALVKIRIGCCVSQGCCKNIWCVHLLALQRTVPKSHTVCVRAVSKHFSSLVLQ